MLPRSDRPALANIAPPLLSMAEAAKLLGICVKTLRRHVQAGEISYIAIGRGTKRPWRKFAVEDIEEFKARHRRTDFEPPPEATLPQRRRKRTELPGPVTYDFAARLALSRSAPPKKSH